MTHWEILYLGITQSVSFIIHAGSLFQTFQILWFQQQFDDKIWWSTTTCQIQSIHHQSSDLLLSMHFWQELSNLEDRVFDAFYSYILYYGGISDQFPSPDCDAGCWDNVALNNQEMGSKRIVKLLRRSRREECRHILRLVRRQRF